MAKKKMTLEEKLEEAIVKDVPYEVPGNWMFVKLVNLLSSMTTKKPNKDEEFFRYIDIDAIDNRNQKVSEPKIMEVNKAPSRASRELMEGDIVFSTVRPYLKNIALIPTEYKDCIASTGFYVCRCKEIISNKYLYYLLCSERVINYYTSLMKGDNSPSIRKEEFENLIVPLPPLKEQQRIVDKIESLFEKLDKANELIEEAREDFEKRKSAVLEKAFRGELTRAWRSNNLVDYNSTWTKQEFSNIAKVKSNLVKPQEFLKYPHIAPDNIEKKTGKLLDYRTIEEDNVKSAKHRFYPGQIIYSKIRPYLSKVVIVDFEGLCSADMYPIETDLDTKYLYYYMLSDTFVNFASNSGSRSVLPKINQKELGKIIVPVCSINEQKEIVRILDKLLEEESRIEELTQLEEQIELIKKSILAKAFRGQLGTNCEDDESALELLKKILSKE
ncbi:restriction endonuclease subunit S [uncultured Clostridium sp.]|uniref:restriction endonuclease subunit S n=1 Tax=uncultured Clostridium sp. TaxID=59620 RepID=UPI0025DF984F|nr:restriction endonuclease subunit S [uncultured Clostridium sp.]